MRLRFCFGCLFLCLPLSATFFFFSTFFFAVLNIFVFLIVFPSLCVRDQELENARSVSSSKLRTLFFKDRRRKQKKHKQGQMQVTRHNASLVLQDFKRDLAKCDFVAMDQEMCGIQRAGKEVLRSMTPVEAWSGPFFAARTYVAFQCGLCLCRVRRDGSSSAAAAAAAPAAVSATTTMVGEEPPLTPTTTSAASSTFVPSAATVAADKTSVISLAGSTHRLEVKPYNFWLRGHGRNAPDVTLNMDAIDFLARNGMDFNMWLRDGMEYCGSVAAESARAKLLPRGYPATANDIAVNFARYIKSIVVDQWYRGLPVDFSQSFAEYCAASVASASGTSLADADQDQQQPQLSKAQRKKEAKREAAASGGDNNTNNSGGLPAAAIAGSGDQTQHQQQPTVVALRRILSGSVGGKVCTTPPLAGLSASSPSSAAAAQAASAASSSSSVTMPAAQQLLSSLHSQLGKHTVTPESSAAASAASAAASSACCSAAFPEAFTTANPQRVLVVAASPDGTLAAGATVDGTVKIWSILSMQHIATLRVQQQQQNDHQSKRKKLQASSTSSSTSHQTNNYNNNSNNAHWHAHFSITTLAFHPNSAFIAAGTSLGSVALWEISTAVQVQHMYPASMTASSHRGGGTGAAAAGSLMGVTAVKFDSRGLNLAIVTANGTLAVWDVVRATYLVSPRRISFWEEDECDEGSVSSSVDDRIQSNEGGDFDEDDDDMDGSSGRGGKQPHHLHEGGAECEGREEGDDGMTTMMDPVVSFLQYSADGSLLLLGFVSDRRIRAYNSSTLESVPSFFLPKELLFTSRRNSIDNRSNPGQQQQQQSSSRRCLSFATVVSPSGRICAAPNMPAPSLVATGGAAAFVASSSSSSSSSPFAKKKEKKRKSGGGGDDDDNGGDESDTSAGNNNNSNITKQPMGSGSSAAAAEEAAFISSTARFAIALCDCHVGAISSPSTSSGSSSGAHQPPQFVRFLVGHTAPVTALEFSGDSSRLLSSSAFDGSTRMWDVEKSMQQLPSSSSSCVVVCTVPIVVLQHGPRVLQSSVLDSLMSAMRVQGAPLGRKATAALKGNNGHNEASESDTCEAMIENAAALVFRGGGGGGTGAICFAGRANAVATCSCTDGNVSVWETRREEAGSVGGGVVLAALECITVTLPERASSELAAMLQTDLMAAKCEVEFERKHVGGRFVFRRRAAGFHDQLMRRRQEELQERLGFRLFFEALKESKKPIVGHHFTSDLAFFINQHECGIREDFAWFKRTVHSLFPSVYDTKAIAARYGAMHINLEDLFNRRQAGRFVVEMQLPMAFLSYHPSAGNSGAVASAFSQASSSSSSSLSGGASVWQKHHHHSSSSSSSLAVAHQGAYDAMMTGVVFWSLVQEHANNLLSEMENAISFFGINYWMNLDSNYDFLAWCQVIMVEHPTEHFQGEAHIREFLEHNCPGAVDEVPGAYVQFVKQGTVFNIVVRPHASASRIEALGQKLQRAGFKYPKQWAGKVSSMSMTAASQQQAAVDGGVGSAAAATAGGVGGAGTGAGGNGNADAGGNKPSKKQRREQGRAQSEQKAQAVATAQQLSQQQQQQQRSRGSSLGSRAQDSAASSQMGDGDREDST